MCCCPNSNGWAMVTQKIIRDKLAMTVSKSMVHRINPYSAVFLLFLFQAVDVPVLISGNEKGMLCDSMTHSVQDTVKNLPPGVIILSVKCKQKPEQSYALYIPSSYMPEKRRPIVYIFDPGARGSIPVELMKEAAERYGYILAASNNSRNGSLEPQEKAANAMWEDTHARLAIDNHCVYFAGFSGGARMASLLAQECECAQGVMLSGAGFSTYSQPSRMDRFAVFSIVGLLDFNYDEMIKLDKTLHKLGISHFLRRFNGPHQWAPKDIWLEAFAWMRLAAMKNGRLPRDEQFIASELALALQRAQVLADSGSVYYALQNYTEDADIFQGLTDTRKLDEHAAVLRTNPDALEGSEREEKQIDEQIRLQNKILSILQLMHKPKPKWLTSGQLNNYDAGGFTYGELRNQARDAIRRLEKDLENENRREKRLVLDRARGVVFVSLMETAKFDLDSNDLQIARDFFELAAEAQPAMYGPRVSLARCLVRMGEKEESIHELGRARELGLSPQELVDLSKQLPELSPMIGDPEFQKLIQDSSPGH